ncbi:PAS domain S-box protein [Desulfonatronovibrio magnus]|uniref:PAS domain S-box protein n=1 Tax=Desulfonatronovibrio magnus TaxID=698827 RepID=UPI000697203D|nr:PAS domain S-box protein [Desulfonatronovibrio magnus]
MKDDLIEKLKTRVKFLEETQRNIIDTLNSTADWADFRPEHGRFEDRMDILKDIASRIIRLAQFKSIGIWLVDEETNSFDFVLNDPADTKAQLCSEFDHLVDDGLIALAINSEKPVFASASETQGRFMIQAIATASRIRGIFLGHLEHGQGLPDATIPLVMILCQNCASSLEALELYSLLRKKNEALIEREDRLAKVMTAINEGIWDWDITDDKLYFDDRYYTMAGYEPGEFASTFEEFAKRVHPDDFITLKKLIDDNFSGQKEVLDWVFRFLKRDGEWLWIRGRGKVVQRDRQGNPMRMVGTHTDISDRMLAEQNLLVSEERYRLLSDVTMEGIVIHKSGIVKDVNTSMTKIFGYTRDELLGRDILEVAFHPEDHVVIRENIIKDYARPYTVRGIRKNGEVFHAELEARNFQVGTDEYRVGAVRDISERIKARNELMLSHDRLKTVMNSIEAFVFIIDMDSHKVLFCNEFASRVFGDIIGKECWKVIQAQQDGPCSFCTNHELISPDGKPSGVYTWEYRNSLTGRWYDCRDRAIHWIDGRLVRMEIATDITQRKEAQEKLTEVNQELEQALAEKDKFFSIIAHDLKSPMSGLLSLSQMIAADGVSWTRDEIKEASAGLYRSSKSLFALLENLLQWARMQRGLIKFEPESRELCELVSINTGVLESVAAQKKIKIVQSVPDGLEVWADEFMINTILRNLLSNAIKFTPRGGTVNISAEKIADFVELGIHDNGMGMEEDDIAKVFSIAHKSVMPGTEGETSTGLGLILCKDFVEKHGGKIRIESRVGEGTSVLFTLPQSEGS